MQRQAMKLAVLLICFLALAASGCGGDSKPKLAEVSGVVKWKDGKPVEGAVVKFHPSSSAGEAAPTSSGKTDSEGRFTLKTAQRDVGAVVGEHTVRITLIEEDESDDTGDSMTSHIAAKYNTESQITFSVPEEGSDRANFTVERAK